MIPTPSRATMSVVGMYNHNEHFFDNLTFTADAPSRDLIIHTILTECAQLEVLYADANFMKARFLDWSLKYYDQIERFIAAANAQYDPIENYDRYETRSRSGEHTDTHTERNTSSGSATATQATTERGESTDNTTNSHNVAGYNSATAVLASQDVTSGTGTTAGNTVSNAESANDTTENKNLTMEGASNDLENAHIHGNIGVTTAQQMINAEIDLLPRINVVNYIVELFKHDFCILVY